MHAYCSTLRGACQEFFFFFLKKLLTKSEKSDIIKAHRGGRQAPGELEGTKNEKES
nr:MAG TPA: hypothetical protein [Caudoviricetes sp.]